MRKYALKYVLKNTIYTRYYLIKMVKYFFNYGVYKEGIKSKFLYRGMNKEFQISNDYEENGFMSLTMSLCVAKDFTGKDGGNIICFNIKKLPEDTPFIIIDESINESLAEQEVLFLPGKIFTKQKESFYEALYDMNPTFKEIKKMDSKMKGGGLKNNDLVDLKGKHIVWWRAIKGRNVEVVGMIRMPDRRDEVEKFFIDVILPHDDLFENKNDFIPQYKDLKDKFFKFDELDKNDMELYVSFFVNMAIYDAKNKKILSIHYGVYEEMFNEELFNSNRALEVHEAIKNIVHGCQNSIWSFMLKLFCNDSNSLNRSEK